jgi:hypothetical protein
MPSGLPLGVTVGAGRAVDPGPSVGNTSSCTIGGRVGKPDSAGVAVASGVPVICGMAVASGAGSSAKLLVWFTAVQPAKNSASAQHTASKIRFKAHPPFPPHYTTFPRNLA